METRSLFAALVGRPNVGKSSLLNALLGEKIAIVTDKPQTTRTRITGVLTVDPVQYVFVDTPGLHKAHNKLSNAMVKAVHSSLGDVDLAILLIDASLKIGAPELELIEDIKKSGLPSVLVINKIDLLPKKEEVAAVIAEAAKLHDFDEIIPISVLQNDGVSLVLDAITPFAVESVHYFPDDSLTDQPERLLVAEMVREKLMQNLQQEVPHGIAVVVERMRERENAAIMDIDVTIYCERKTHKGIIIGKGGAMLKQVASQARADMEHFLDVKVNLQCWVKVREGWRDSENFIREIGLNDN